MFFNLIVDVFSKAVVVVDKRVCEDFFCIKKKKINKKKLHFFSVAKVCDLKKLLANSKI